jgi:hypothetical protein
MTNQEKEILKQHFKEEFPNLSDKMIDNVISNDELILFEPDELLERENIIKGYQKSLIEKKIASEQTFQTWMFLTYKQFLHKIRVLSNEMIYDFLYGICLVDKGDNKAFKLMSPAIITIQKLVIPEQIINDQINKYIFQYDKIIASNNTHEAREEVKEFIKNKPILPFFKQDIIRIREECRLSLEKEYQKIKHELSGNVLMGFACPHLAPETVEEIYNLMSEKQISGNPEDFKAIFSNSSNTVTKPIQWLKKSQRRDEKGRYRGHQTMLHLFIEKMLQRNLTADEKRKTSKLFIDEYGEFFTPKSREPKEKDRNTNRIFLKEINDIIKKHPTQLHL